MVGTSYHNDSADRFVSVCFIICVPTVWCHNTELNSFLFEAFFKKIFELLSGIKHAAVWFPKLSFFFFFFYIPKADCISLESFRGIKAPKAFSQSLCLLSSCIHSLPCHVCAIYPAEAQVNKQPIQPHAAPNYTAKLMAGSISRRRANRTVCTVRKHAGMNTPSACWWGMCGYVYRVPVGLLESPADSVCTHDSRCWGPC